MLLQCLLISMYLHLVTVYHATCWKSNYLSEPPMQRGGLLGLKDTEINISAPEETFPVTEATNLSRAFTLMLAFTVAFPLIAYQEISSLLVLALTKPKKKIKRLQISIIRGRRIHTLHIILQFFITLAY